MINDVTLVGRLGADPEVRQAGNRYVYRANVATWKSRYDEQKKEWQDITEWHRVVMWREDNKLELRKGDMVAVKGELHTSKFTDSDGKDRYFTEVVGYIRRVTKKTTGNTDDDDLPIG